MQAWNFARLHMSSSPFFYRYAHISASSFKNSGRYPSLICKKRMTFEKEKRYQLKASFFICRWILRYTTSWLS